MTTFGIRALAVAALLAAQGCILDVKRGGGPQLIRGRYHGRDTGPAGKRSLTDGFGPKSVEGKQPPTRLLARDGTSCSVPKKKFDRTVVGASVWCTWIDTNR